MKIPSWEGLGLCPPNPPVGGEGGVGLIFKFQWFEGWNEELTQRKSKGGTELHKVFLEP